MFPYMVAHSVVQLIHVAIMRTQMVVIGSMTTIMGMVVHPKQTTTRDFVRIVWVSSLYKLQFNRYT